MSSEPDSGQSGETGKTEPAAASQPVVSAEPKTDAKVTEKADNSDGATTASKAQATPADATSKSASSKPDTAATEGAKEVKPQATKPRRTAGGKPSQPDAKNLARSAHFVELPPTIRPKAKPQPAVGAPVPVRRVGHAEGESGPSQGSRRPGRPAYVAASAPNVPMAPPVGNASPVPVTPIPTPIPPTPDPPEVSPRHPEIGKATKFRRGFKKNQPIPTGAPTAPATAPNPMTITAGGIQTGGTQLTSSAGQNPDRRTGRIRLNLSYVSPLSVMKISFLVFIALGIAFVIAVYILWNALDDRAVFTQIDDMVTQLVGTKRPESLNILKYVEQGRVMSGAVIVAVIDVIVFTVISTLMAVVYNIIAALVGGVHVTLREQK